MGKKFKVLGFVTRSKPGNHGEDRQSTYSFVVLITLILNKTDLFLTPR